MIFARSLFGVLAAIAAAIALGFFCALTWLTQVSIIIKLAIGIACMLLMLWPVGTLLLIRPEIEVFFGALSLAVVVALLSVPVFVESLTYFVRVLANMELQRAIRGITYICALAGALLGVFDTLRRARSWLFRNITIGTLLLSSLGLVLMIGLVAMYGV